MNRRWSLGLRTTLFSFLLPGTLGGWLPPVLARSAGASWPDQVGARALGGVTLLALGTMLYLRCATGFVLEGDGTPAPFDAPSRLVARGPYRYTRNPMYLGVLTAVLGWAALAGTRALAGYGLLLATGFHLFVVLYEEPTLRHRFGEEYRRYCREVPRWLPRGSGAERPGAD